MMPGRSALVVALLLVEVSFSPTLTQANPQKSPAQQPPTAGKEARHENEARLLEAGKPIKGELRGGEAHVYQVRMDVGQFLHADVDHRGVNVYVAAYDPDGKLVRAVFTLSGTYGLEPVSLLAEVSGNYRIEVHAFEKDAPAGKYAIEIKKLGSPTEQDKARLAAEDAFVNGLQIRVRLGMEPKQESLKQFEIALSNWRAVGDRYGEALTLQTMGLTYFMMGENQSALNHYNQAIPLLRAVGDRSGEATTLNGIGRVYDTLGEKQKALDSYNQALLLRRAVGDRPGEAMALNNIGVVYNDLGEKQKALDYYIEALQLRRAVGDPQGEAATLGNIGTVYDDLGEKQKALDYYNQALSINRVLGNRSGEAVILTNIGAVYDHLGEKLKALEYYNQALPLKREMGDRFAMAAILNDIGLVYDDLGEKLKALDYYSQALPLKQAVGDRAGEAATLHNIGAVYGALGDTQKALDYYGKALSLLRAVGDRSGEARTLSNIGSVQASLGQNQEARDNYMRALALAREVRDPLIEGHVLSNLMDYWRGLRNPSLAIFFGKQAVNSIQQIRRNITGLEQGTQRSFLKSKEGIYRDLAESLISEGRLFEAQQVLGLLKVQEYLDFTRATRGEAPSATSSLALTRTELDFEKRYEAVTDQLAAFGREWTELSGKASRTPEEERRFQDLSGKLDSASRALQGFFEDLYSAFGKSTGADKEQRDLQRNASDMQSILQELEPGTVALYTLVAPERVFVLVVTPDVTVARQHTISAEELRNKVFGLWKVLRSRDEDPLPAAQELYRILIGPIQKDLDAYGAKTLMWSLDDVLRYIPMAALHDGKTYLVEKYRNEVFTQASISKLKDRLTAKTWQALAMGVSKPRGHMRPLPAVPNELHGIVHTEGSSKGGLLPGRLLLDDAFTQEDMIRSLQLRFPLVHIASHFSFQPGDESHSFLLLGGKGQESEAELLSLAQIRTNPNITFRNTELLTLSACDTAMSGTSRGREVDGLGDIVQLKGAKAVLASLWEVDDESTGFLMKNFYEIWTRHPGMPKAEALRQAQLALLHGEVKGSFEASFANPHFWAPFILFGNWR